MTLATGIYADRYGISIKGPKGSEKGHRYPLGTPLEELRSARRDLLRAHEARPRAGRRTLAKGIEAYLDTMPESPPLKRERTPNEPLGPRVHRRRDERALLQHWIEAGFGDREMDEIKPLEIRQQLAQWKTHARPSRESTPDRLEGTPLALGTLKHLRRVLGAVYRAVNGKSGYNPVRDVPAINVRYEEPRAIPYEVIELIFKHMPDVGRGEKGTAKRAGGDGRPTISKTKIRLRVMAYTGLPPAQLKRIVPRDLHLAKKEVLARPRRKGAGAEGKMLPLSDQGVREFKAFAQHECFGWFNSRSAAKTFHTAVEKARAEWEADQAKRKQPVAWPLPDDVRAYDLRHSFATEVMLAERDIKRVADMLIHASLETSRRYTLAAVDPQLRETASRLSERWNRGTDRGTPKTSPKKRLDADKRPSF